MSRLLYAGLYRLKKNKVYWSSFAVILAYGTFIYVSQYHNIRKYDFEFTLETAFFQFDGGCDSCGCQYECGDGVW